MKIAKGLEIVKRANGDYEITKEYVGMPIFTNEDIKLIYDTCLGQPNREFILDNFIANMGGDPR